MIYVRFIDSRHHLMDFCLDQILLSIPKSFSNPAVITLLTLGTLCEACPGSKSLVQAQLKKEIDSVDTITCEIHSEAIFSYWKPRRNIVPTIATSNTTLDRYCEALKEAFHLTSSFFSSVNYGKYANMTHKLTE